MLLTNIKGFSGGRCIFSRARSASGFRLTVHNRLSSKGDPMKTLTGMLMIGLFVAQLNGCGGGSSGAAGSGATPVTGVATPGAVAVVTAN
jgi:hypothetical protein